MLALGLPAQVLAKTWAAAFYAREDTRTPLIATLVALAVAMVAALLLGRLFGAAGVALAVALGGWSNAAVLLWRGLRRFGVTIDASARRRIVLIAVAAAAMGGLLALKATFALPWVTAAGTLAQAAALGVLIAGGLIVYVGLLVLFGVVRPAALGTALRSPRGLRG